MITKTIKYKDYNGANREEEYYFNINTDEVLNMGNDTAGETTYNKLKALVTNLNTFIVKAYGEKSADGKRFVKTEEATREFSQSKAYSMIYLDLVQHPEEADKFVLGVLEPELVEIFNLEEAKVMPAGEASNKVVSIDSKKG